MARRVRRPDDKDDLLKTLTENDEPFSTMAAAMVFAAAVGHANDRRSEFEKTAEQIPWEVFSNSGLESFIDLLAGAVSDDKDILAIERADDRVQLFEEYANGGLEIMRDRIAGSQRPPLDTMLDLVLEFEHRDDGKGKVDLEAIAADLSS